MGQLPLDLAFAPRYGAENFLRSSSNAVACEMLMRWPDWPGRMMVLVGPEGSGKSHLASIWAELSHARSYRGRELGSIKPQVFAEHPTVLDDADALGGAEATLFHAINLVQESGSFLLMTAKTPPDHWGLATGDLLSRLRLAPLLPLDPPDTALLRAVLIKLFLDRQLIVDKPVVEYLTLNLDRSLGAARQLVDVLDRTSLADQRKITRPIAAKVLASLGD